MFLPTTDLQGGLRLPTLQIQIEFIVTGRLSVLFSGEITSIRHFIILTFFTQPLRRSEIKKQHIST